MITQCGECMECGASADLLAVELLCCASCGSDQISVRSEEDGS